MFSVKSNVRYATFLLQIGINENCRATASTMLTSSVAENMRFRFGITPEYFVSKSVETAQHEQRGVNQC